MFDNRPIGIFDSGVGGLSVLKECIEILPNENFIYFGDIANAPYGDKSIDELIVLAKNNVNFLIKNNCKAILIACNTISSNAYKNLAQSVDLPIIEVILPAVQEATNISKNKKVAVLATKATVNSHMYLKELSSHNFETIMEIACPSFVPLIEREASSDEILKAIIKDVEDIKDCDTIILGCTHYPYIEKEIRYIFKNVNIVNPAKKTAQKLKDILNKKNIKSDNRSFIRLYSSKNTNLFNKLSEKFQYEK